MDRIEDLHSYQILDTAPESELNDLAEIARAIFDTPVSIISFIDEKRQWYKAKIGLEFDEVNIEDTFCKLTLDNPDEILIIEKPIDDERVKDHPKVNCKNGISFYASAPLVSKEGNVLGTVCVFDYEKKIFSSKAYDALKLISKKVMDYLETRKMLYLQSQEIENNAARLKRITDLVPGVIFKMILNKNGAFNFIFISEGIQRLIPSLSPDELKKNPKKILDYFPREDRYHFFKLFNTKTGFFQPIETECNVRVSPNQMKWLSLKANPEKRNEDEIVWVGMLQDITQKINHMKVLEKMVFDISHVIRRPIANILSVGSIFQAIEIPEEEKMEMFQIIFNETSKLDDSINYLNQEYYDLWQELKIIWKDNE